MSTLSSERPQNPLRFSSQFARAASAAWALLVCAGLASPVAGGDGIGPQAPDRAGLSAIAREVLRRGAAGPAQSADEPTIPAAPEDEDQAVDGRAPDVASPPADLVPALEGITVAIPPGAKALKTAPAAPTAGYDSNSWRQRAVATRGLSFSSGVRAPASGLDPALRAQADGLRAQGRQFVYGFLLLRVPLDEQIEQKLARLGVHLLGRHDDHHKARLPVGALSAVAALPEVEWVGVSAPEQKASPELAELRGPQATAPALDPTTPIPIVVNLFEADEQGSFRRRLEAVGAAVGEYDADLHFYRAVATNPVIERIAALDFVLFIDLIGLTSPGHDQSMPLVDADLIRPGRTTFGLTRFSGAPIPVGIIDSGAMMGSDGHRDLFTKRGCGRNFSTETAGAFIDLNGHGTHVLATIAGTGNNERYKGVAPGVGEAAAGGSIRLAKVFGKNSSDGTIDAVQSAMDWMAVPGVCDNQPAPLVINYSGGRFGTGLTGTDPMSRTLDYRTWINRQLYVVCSGNDGSSRSVRTPGVAKNALTVGNVYDNGYLTIGDLAPKSSRGPTGDGRMKPNVVAPGSAITSAKAGTTNEYQEESGCSSATPHVTGLAATLMHHYPQFQFNPALVRAHLMATAIGHDGMVGKSNDYGLGRVSGYVAHWDHPNSDGWETYRFWGTVNSFGFAYGDITVPPGAKRLVVVLTWDEPPASAGASRAVTYDINLYVDRDIDCMDPTGACGEYVSLSTVDNVEYVVVHDPAPGVYRLKVVPHDASPTVLPWGMSAVIIRGDVLPGARVPPHSQAMSAYTTGPSFDVEAGRNFAVTVSVANDSYVASGVQIEPVVVPSGVAPSHVETNRLDGVTMSFLDGLGPLTLGNIPPSWSRAATWVFRAITPGSKTFTFRGWSENSGEFTVSRTVNVVPAASNADLTVTGLTMNPAAPARAPGASFSVTATVQNAGTAPSGSSTVRYYLSLDAGKSADDTRLTGSQAVGGLDPGESRSGTVTVTIPASTPLNTYFLLACADDANVVGEPNEDNNCVATPGATVTVGRPDLSATAVAMNPPAPARAPGTTFSVTDTVRNVGAAPSGSSTTRYYLSLDPVKNAGDTLLTGSRGVPGLAGGASQSGTVTVTIPAATPLNTYFLLACADDLNVVVEADESNNNCVPTATATVTVTRPDLTQDTVSSPPATKVRGTSFPVTDTVHNVGTAPSVGSSTRYYLSLDAMKSASDVLLTGSRAVPGLAGGATHSGTITVTIPTATPLGTYFLLACADGGNTVIETDETNNCASSGNTVTITP